MAKFTPPEVHALTSFGWHLSGDTALHGYQFGIVATVAPDGSYSVACEGDIIAAGREDNAILAALEANDRAYKRRAMLRMPGL